MHPATQTQPLTDRQVAAYARDGYLDAGPLLDAAEVTVIRKITRRRSAGIGELVTLGLPSGPLRIRIEALNDLGEVVASSAVHEIAR